MINKSMSLIKKDQCCQMIIAINRIQNKSFVCTIYVCTVYIYDIYIYIHTYSIYFENNYMYLHVYLYSYNLYYK